MKKLFVFLVFLCLAAGVVIFLTSRSANNSKGLQPIPPKNLLQAGTLTWSKYEGVLKSAPDGLDIFMLAWGFQAFDQNAKWDYMSTPFWATINSISKVDSKLNITFSGPKSIPLKGETRDVSIVDCNRSNSFLTVERPKMIAGDVIFFNYAKVGDSLISFCLNLECSQIGKMCKLYKKQNEKTI